MIFALLEENKSKTPTLDLFFFSFSKYNTKNFNSLLVFSSQKQTNDQQPIVKRSFLETLLILNPSFLKANLFQKYTNAQPHVFKNEKTKKNTPSFFVFYSGEFSCTCVRLALLSKARAHFTFYPTHFKNKRFLLHY